MRPAASLIAFTTLSGAGFGVLALIGLSLGPDRGLALVLLFALGAALAAGGLFASSFHLGRPERAAKAFREWRSSWLSREAWLAAATMATMTLWAAGRVLGAPVAALGGLGAALAVATVAATAMIYAQLRTVPRWHHWSVPALFLGHAATAGALLSGLAGPAAVLLVATGLGQALAWWAGDRREARAPETTASATGLGGIGRVRPFEAPHTGESYLTREMVFVVGRRHARVLRALSLAIGFALPFCLALLGGWALAPAAVLHLAGTAMARWLFFAEARHVMARYYR